MRRWILILAGCLAAMGCLGGCGSTPSDPSFPIRTSAAASPVASPSPSGGPVASPSPSIAPTGSPSPSPSATPTVGGLLYVSNTNAPSLLTFSQARTVTGDTPATRTVEGAATGLNTNFHMTLDAGRNVIYVSNAADSTVRIWDNASQANGNQAPTRVLGGSLTRLNTPGGIFLDAASDTLYVANIEASTVTIYANASTLNGNQAPTRELTGVTRPFGLTVGGDRLYVALSSSAAIGVWDNASTVNGAIAATRTIRAAELNTPDGLFYDVAANRLFVADQAARIISFDNASLLNGTVSANRVVSGSATGLGLPTDVFLDAALNQIYVSDRTQNAVSVFANASTANGNVGPARRITGQISTVNGPTGLALDLTRSN